MGRYVGGLKGSELWIMTSKRIKQIQCSTGSDSVDGGEADFHSLSGGLLIVYADDGCGPGYIFRLLIDRALDTV